MTGPIDESALLGHIVRLARELGRFPTIRDLRVKRTNDGTFPSPTVFERLGKKADIVRQVRVFCEAHTDYADVLPWCLSVPEASVVSDVEDALTTATNDGFVYLMKSGRFYKIGKTNSVGRRERELTIQLPETTKAVHSIRTDDPVGIEAYWHKRFEAKRKNGEWFNLTREEVAAFRRRKFM